MIAERLLQRMQSAAVPRQSFDRGDLDTVGLHREQQAGAHRRAVEQHGAGAAGAVLAADVGAGQPEIGAQEIGEMPARLDLAGEAAAIDVEGDGLSGGHQLKAIADRPLIATNPACARVLPSSQGGFVMKAMRNAVAALGLGVTLAVGTAAAQEMKEKTIRDQLI